MSQALGRVQLHTLWRIVVPAQVYSLHPSFSIETSPIAITLDSFSPRSIYPSVSKDVAEHICTVLEANRSVASAPLTRQFDEFILGFSHVFPLNKPIVIVIDALDEGYSFISALNLPVQGSKTSRILPTFHHLPIGRHYRDEHQRCPC
jgi:hypothetical protein